MTANGCVSPQASAQVAPEAHEIVQLPRQRVPQSESVLHSMRLVRPTTNEQRASGSHSKSAPWPAVRVQIAFSSQSAVQADSQRPVQMPPWGHCKAQSALPHG